MQCFNTTSPHTILTQYTPYTIVVPTLMILPQYLIYYYHVSSIECQQHWNFIGWLHWHHPHFHLLTTTFAYCWQPIHDSITNHIHMYIRATISTINTRTLIVHTYNTYTLSYKLNTYIQLHHHNPIHYTHAMYCMNIQPTHYTTAYQHINTPTLRHCHWTNFISWSHQQPLTTNTHAYTHFEHVHILFVVIYIVLSHSLNHMLVVALFLCWITLVLPTNTHTHNPNTIFGYTYMIHTLLQHQHT